MALSSYSSTSQKIWHYSFRFFCFLVFSFLILPIIVIIPLSFNALDFFTFTDKMLALDPTGYSLKHYDDFFNNPNWQLALKNSFKIAPTAAIIATILGTLAAIGLSRTHVPFRNSIMVLIISPMITPIIIVAAGMYFFYSRIGLQGSFWGVVIADIAIGAPFVVVTVTATLTGFDNMLTKAAASLGSRPIRTFFKIQLPLILPGVISGGLFAFIIALDELVIILFVGTAEHKTLSWQMFTGLREQISPTILAVASFMVLLSLLFLSSIELLRRRTVRLRGLSSD